MSGCNRILVISFYFDSRKTIECTLLHVWRGEVSLEIYSFPGRNFIHYPNTERHMKTHSVDCLKLLWKNSDGVLEELKCFVDRVDFTDAIIKTLKNYIRNYNEQYVLVISDEHYLKLQTSDDFFLKDIFYNVARNSYKMCKPSLDLPSTSKYLSLIHI